MIERVRFDKGTAGFCRKTLYGIEIFGQEMEGYLDELIWAFLKKGMRIQSHRHPQKEIYIFTKGRGAVAIGDEKMAVREGDVVFIPSNSIHTAWNNSDMDLEFVIVRSRDIGPRMKKIAKKLSIFLNF